MAKTDKTVFIALPAMDEAETMPVFLDCLRKQTYSNFKLFVCVNQPDDWWSRPDKLEFCLNNQNTISMLKKETAIDTVIMDKSSQGKGWKGKKTGVGWARKSIMNKITEVASNQDIIVSLDADTSFRKNYLHSLVENLNKQTEAVAISVPYYHKLTGDELKDRSILRYEIFMRYYALNLWRIENPYSFTAIGSAIALPVKSYKAIGGMTPHKSGEDFYFLQKLRKYGQVVTWNREKVYPAARYSDRVGFGTGPAMIKGRAGDWSSYPFYPFELFDEVKTTHDLFPQLFEKDIPTPMDEFNEMKFSEVNIWKPLRENFKTPERFIRACTHKIDAFRVLQFLKWKNDQLERKDEEQLILWFEKFHKDVNKDLTFDIQDLSFSEGEISELDDIRNAMVKLEEEYQKNNFTH